MASTNKTSLGLNQWEASDKPVRQDFVNDNVIIDQKLAKLDGDVTKKIDRSPALVADANTATEMLFNYNGSTINTPATQGVTGAKNGLIIQTTDGAGNDSYATQLAIPQSHAQLFIRSKQKGTSWSLWVALIK